MMSGLLGKIPKFTLRLPASLAKYGRTMSECPLELSFSLCDDNVCVKTKNEDLRSPLKVHLPTEDLNQAEKKCEIESHEAEKADEEKSEKGDNMEVTCSVSVDGQEKQEFSFTLYDFDTKDKGNKQDMEKIVVRSICEALGKTLKLPPSGSRTIKVKLAISPDTAKESNPNDPIEPENMAKWPVEAQVVSETVRNQGYDSSKSANTASTYLLSSATEKTRHNYPRFSNDFPPLLSTIPLQDVKSMQATKKSIRHNHMVSVQQELKSGMKDQKKTANENVPDNRVTHNDLSTNSFDDTNPASFVQPPNSRDHVPESRDRRNHYLDLAGVDSETKHQENSQQRHFGPNFLDPNFICPYRILDRTHVCSKAHRNRDFPFSPIKKQSILCHPKVNAGPSEMSYKIDKNTRDDLLNLNFDLCDIVPNVKFDWEKVQHRRSKSYDLHETGYHQTASPKMKGKQNASADNQKNTAHGLNSTPIHHYRFRNRDREKQRAMQQVANWITREHSANKDESEIAHFMCKGLSKNSQTTNNDKCEHHHHHEHVHHHYHHFAEF